MSSTHALSYSGGTPGADSNSYTFFDTSTDDVLKASGAQSLGFQSYLLTLNNSAAGTLVVSGKVAGASNYTTLASIRLPAARTNVPNVLPPFPLDNYGEFKVVWTNGGSAQSTFTVIQSLSKDPSGTLYGSHHTQTAARIKGPVEDTSKFAATIGTTATAYAVHTEWLGRRVLIKNSCSSSNPSAKIWILFGTSSSVTASSSRWTT